MFSKKRLKVVIQLIEENAVLFNREDGTPSNNLTFEDMPIDVKIDITALPSGGNANVKIYGVSKEYMQAITTIRWRQAFIPQKAIYIYADDGEGYKQIFEGNIMQAMPRYDSVPNTYIEINATMGAYHNIEEVPPFYYIGEASTSDVFRDICAAYNVECVNHEVTGMVKNPYFDEEGLSNRLTAASRAYNVYVVLKNNVVHIYPSDTGVSARWTFQPIDWIGYPQITETGLQISLDAVYPVDLRDYFQCLGSEVDVANKDFYFDTSWKIVKFSYSLSTKIGGKWFMTIDGVRVDFGTWEDYEYERYSNK